MKGFKKRIAKCAGYGIDLRLHVLHFKLVSEQIGAEEVNENLERLKKQDFENLRFLKPVNRHKYKLYFRHSKNILHKYIIDIRDSERTIRVVTVHKIHRDSQKRFDRYARR